MIARWLKHRGEQFPLMGEEMNCYYKIYGDLIFYVPHYMEQIYGK